MSRKYWMLVGCCAAVSVIVVGCTFPFPTTDDVNTLQVAERAFVSGEHAGIVDAFTKQHELQNPDLSPELQAVVSQYNALAAQLREIADETKAEGLDVTETELWSMAVAAFPGLAGVGLWLRNSSKPSRSADKVADLESEVSAQKAELTALIKDLATAAGAKEAIPSAA